jgi:hypothetical protein
MSEDEEIFEEEWEEDETSVLPLDEHPSLLKSAVSHPRIALGGGSLLLSFAVDVAIRFDPFVTVLGLATAVAIGWNGDAVARGMQSLIPGLDQGQVQEDADRFADQLLLDSPLHPDQRPIAKLKRLFRIDESDVVEEAPLPKKGRAKNYQVKDGEEGFTFERIARWLEEGRINDKQFFFLLQRLDTGSAVSDHRNGNGNETQNGRDSASEEAVSPQPSSLRPPGWDAEKIHQIIGAFRATNHLDNSLKALDLSTSQRNRDFAREILKQQGLWKEK